MSGIAKTLVLLVVLAGCTQFPQLDAVITDEARASGYPDLQRSSIFSKVRKDGRLKPDDGEILLKRAADLNRRAEILRKIEVVNDETRKKVAGALKRFNG